MLGTSQNHIFYCIPTFLIGSKAKKSLTKKLRERQSFIPGGDEDEDEYYDEDEGGAYDEAPKAKKGKSSRGKSGRKVRKVKRAKGGSKKDMGFFQVSHCLHSFIANLSELSSSQMSPGAPAKPLGEPEYDEDEDGEGEYQEDAAEPTDKRYPTNMLTFVILLVSRWCTYYYEYSSSVSPVKQPA